MDRNEPKSVTLTVSLDEVNKILQALGTLPFAEVYDLIGKVNKQANDQLTGNANN